MITLSPLESRLLERLIQAKQRAVNRQTLTDHCWRGAPPKSPTAVDAVVAQLRRKLPNCVTTHPSRGWAITPGFRRPAYEIAGPGYATHRRPGGSPNASTFGHDKEPCLVEYRGGLIELTYLEHGVFEELKRHRGTFMDVARLSKLLKTPQDLIGPAASALAKKMPSIQHEWGRGWSL